MPSDRARQFLPFDALKGFKEEIKKRERIIVEKKELSESDLLELSRKILLVEKNMMVEVIYYCNEEYVSRHGMVSKIDFDNNQLVIVKTKIEFSDIIEINIE